MSWWYSGFGRYFLSPIDVLLTVGCRCPKPPYGEVRLCQVCQEPGAIRRRWDNILLEKRVMLRISKREDNYWNKIIVRIIDSRCPGVITLNCIYGTYA
jgi:hypothetical protein